MPPSRRASRVTKDERETNRAILALEAAALLLLLRATKKRDVREVERVLVDQAQKARVLARQRVAAELRYPVTAKPLPASVRIVRRIDMGDGTYREVVSTHPASVPPLGKLERLRLRKLSRTMVADANERDRAARGAANPREARAAARASTESHVRLVATTETMDAFSRERERLAREIADRTDAAVYKEWRSTLDMRACEKCSALHGTFLPLARGFPQGDPPLHPRCRCWVLYSIENVVGAALSALWASNE